MGLAAVQGGGAVNTMHLARDDGKRIRVWQHPFHMLEAGVSPEHAGGGPPAMSRVAQTLVVERRCVHNEFHASSTLYQFWHLHEQRLLWQNA